MSGQVVGRRSAWVVGVLMIAAGVVSCGDEEPRYGRVLISAAAVDKSGCPDIQNVVVAPAQASVGGQIGLNASATVGRATDTLVYAWSPVASIKLASSPNTAYTCPKTGRQTLTLTVTETNRSGSCAVEQSLSVLCL